MRLLCLGWRESNSLRLQKQILQVGEFLPPNLFVRESANLPQGCRLAKMSAKPHGKGGERNRKGFQLSPA